MSATSRHSEACVIDAGVTNASPFKLQGVFGSVMGVLTIFGAEKAVFKREYGSRLYSLSSYFWSR